MHVRVDLRSPLSTIAPECMDFHSTPRLLHPNYHVLKLWAAFDIGNVRDAYIAIRCSGSFPIRSAL